MISCDIRKDDSLPRWGGWWARRSARRWGRPRARRSGAPSAVLPACKLGDKVNHRSASSSRWMRPKGSFGGLWAYPAGLRAWAGAWARPSGSVRATVTNMSLMRQHMIATACSLDSFQRESSCPLPPSKTKSSRGGLRRSAPGSAPPWGPKWGRASGWPWASAGDPNTTHQRSVLNCNSNGSPSETYESGVIRGAPGREGRGPGGGLLQRASGKIDEHP
jgi:hypothetical protein